MDHPFRRRTTVILPLLAALLGGVATSALPGPAAAQVLESDVDDLRYRLRKLEREFKSMRGSGDRNGVSSTLATRFQNRLNQMERSIQKLTSKVEDLAHRVDKIEKDRKAFKTDIDYRLSLLEKKGGGRTTGRAAARPAERATGPAGAPDKKSRAAREPDRETGPAVLPAGSAVEQYKFAIGELRQARYGRAAQAFREFLRRHPKGRLAGNAYYWLGETYFAQKKFRLAAIRFADGFQKFPKHAKAPDNLLKLGMAMARLNKPREACASWVELRRRYPSAPSYVKRKVAREWRKLDCRG